MTEATTEHAVCTMSDIGMEITGEDAQPVVDAINEYLSAFAKPVAVKTPGITGSCHCLNCGRRLDGFIGTFTFGIAHGEGTCGECGWPCRAVHYPKDANGEDIFDRGLEIILQYHPSGVTKREGATA